MMERMGVRRSRQKWRHPAPFICGVLGPVLLLMAGAAQGADVAPSPPIPTRPLSGMESVIHRDMQALRGDLQRFQEAVIRSNQDPKALVISTVPRLMGRWRAMSTRTSVLKAQAGKNKDVATLKRAEALERQLPAIQQEIASIPGDVEGSDVALARKKCGAKGKKTEYLVVKLEEVFVTGVQPTNP